MENSILTPNETHNVEKYVTGRDFVNAVASASSMEELKQVLNNGGIEGFDDARLEQCYKQIALSQNWDAVSDMLHDKDYESCKHKLAVHGITTSKENFDLINDVIRAGLDDSLVKMAMTETDHAKTASILQENGCTHITEDFLDILSENAQHLNDDGILTHEDIEAMKGKDFWERCSKSIGIVVAMSCITKLILGLDMVNDDGDYEMAYLIAIACGISMQ